MKSEEESESSLGNSVPRDFSLLRLFVPSWKLRFYFELFSPSPYASFFLFLPLIIFPLLLFLLDFSQISLFSLFLSTLLILYPSFYILSFPLSYPFPSFSHTFTLFYALSTLSPSHSLIFSPSFLLPLSSLSSPLISYYLFYDLHKKLLFYPLLKKPLE